MRAIEIADAAIEALDKGGFGFMLINFANGDMVGHTGIMGGRTGCLPHCGRLCRKGRFNGVTKGLDGHVDLGSR